MSKAILTIDDAPTRITPRIVDYLQSKGIVPVISFIGAKIDECFDEAVYAAKSGAVIGNHGFSHPHFSEITLAQARDEILKTEREIDRVCRFAGVEREHRVFRFPYGDKGGERYEALQQLLREFRFERLDDTAVRFPWWETYHLDTDIDMKWTFDFVEYEMAWDNGSTWDDVIRHIHDAHPAMGGSLLEKDATHIVLIHDMEQTDRFMEKYFEKLIDYALACRVEFIRPRFLTPG